MIQNSEVRDAAAALSTKKAIVKKTKLRSRQQKLKAYDLSSLSEPELKDSQEPTPAAEFKLILKEGKQLSTVLNHPAFQADPLAAIYQHLMSTQPVMDAKPKKNTSGSKKKTQKSKASAGHQSMDFHISTLNSGISSIHLDDLVHISS